MSNTVETAYHTHTYTYVCNSTTVS